MKQPKELTWKQKIEIAQAGRDPKRFMFFEERDGMTVLWCKNDKEKAVMTK